MHKKIYTLIIPVMGFLIILILLSPTLLADFGEENGFDSSASSGFSDPVNVESSFFLHDTLIKFIFLSFFSLAAIIIMLYKPSFRKALLAFSVLILGFYLGGFLCPFTSVQNIILKNSSGYLLLFLLPTLMALIWGRIFCGYICPFGALQELLYRCKLDINLPDRIISLLRPIKYILLIYLVLRVLITGDLILAGNTPFSALFTLGGTSLSIVLTVITATLSIITYRPFCQFLCPLGAWLGLISLLNKYKILPGNCIECGQCNVHCKLDAVDNGQINKSECILCHDCCQVCPTGKQDNDDTWS